VSALLDGGRGRGGGLLSRILLGSIHAGKSRDKRQVSDDVRQEVQFSRSRGA